MKNVSIWYVVVVYRPKILVLRQLIGNLKDCNIVVVWNSPHVTREKFSGVCVIQNNHNMGYGAAANKAISYCLKRGADWIVLLNQDIHLTTASVKQLYNKLDSAPAILGSFTGRLDPFRWSTIYSEAVNSRSALEHEVFVYISGACMAMHKRVFQKTHGFYEPYFMYYEDADLSVRAKQAGFTIGEINLSGIHHDDTKTFGKGSFLHMYYLARNHLLFVERQAPLLVKLYEYIRLPKTLWEHYKNKERGALIGIGDYFLRRFGEYKNIYDHWR